MDLQYIHEHVLLGIADALRRFSPHLLPVIERIRTYGTLHPSALGPEKSPYGLFTAEVPAADAQQIGEVLNDIVREEGAEQTFEGWQISFLLLRWQHFTQTPTGD